MATSLRHFAPFIGAKYISLLLLHLQHPNFGSPTNTLTSPLFGHSTQMLASSLAGADNAGFNALYQIGGPRSFQLALKLPAGR
jgi:hypothetical protein